MGAAEHTQQTSTLVKCSIVPMNFQPILQMIMNVYVREHLVLIPTSWCAHFPFRVIVISLLFCKFFWVIHSSSLIICQREPHFSPDITVHSRAQWQWKRNLERGLRSNQLSLASLVTDSDRQTYALLILDHWQSLQDCSNQRFAQTVNFCFIPTYSRLKDRIPLLESG